MNSNILQIYSLHIERIKIMNETKMVLFAGDKIEIAAKIFSWQMDELWRLPWRWLEQNSEDAET